MWCGVVDKASYALSVRDFNDTTREVTIKHYRIRKLDRGGVYISPKKTFSDLLQLVDHYHSECLSRCRRRANFTPELNLCCFATVHQHDSLSVGMHWIQIWIRPDIHSRFCGSGAKFTKHRKICPKIVLRCVLSLSYNIDLRSAKIILRFS